MLHGTRSPAGGWSTRALFGPGVSSGAGRDLGVAHADVIGVLAGPALARTAGVGLAGGVGAHVGAAATRLLGGVHGLADPTRWGRCSGRRPRRRRTIGR